MHEVGRYMRSLRMAQGLSQEELAGAVCHAAGRVQLGEREGAAGY